MDPVTRQIGYALLGGASQTAAIGAALSSVMSSTPPKSLNLVPFVDVGGYGPDYSAGVFDLGYHNPFLTHPGHDSDKFNSNNQPSEGDNFLYLSEGDSPPYPRLSNLALPDFQPPSISLFYQQPHEEQKPSPFNIEQIVQQPVTDLNNPNKESTVLSAYDSYSAKPYEAVYVPAKDKKEDSLENTILEAYDPGRRGEASELATGSTLDDYISSLESAAEEWGELHSEAPVYTEPVSNYPTPNPGYDGLTPPDYSGGPTYADLSEVNDAVNSASGAYTPKSDVSIH